ncbi:hypothetical protein ABH909_005388 [Pseudomonas sp. BS3782 TE3695]|uniref:hypothetical protein n=1 Tax=Pseudomonas sp. BS3782 TE3695 TaxID=3349323 RepID=UPI003D20F571
MNATTQNSSSISKTLKAREAHLTALLKLVDSRIGKNTATQELTIIAIKAEMVLIEHKLKNRK